MDPVAPGADPVAPVTPAVEPVAPVELVAPVDPAAPAPPVEPVAPVVDPVAPVTPPTPEEAADAAEDKEWADAQDELFPGLKSANKEDKKPDEPAKPEDPAKAAEAPKVDPKDQKPNDESGASDGTGAQDADDKKDGDEPAKSDTPEIDARRASRAYQQEVEEVQADVRKAMFADSPTELRDADGDPIRSIDDVMKLINPRTNEPFTDEQAGAWLLSAQQAFNQKKADETKRIEQIAEVNMDLKDQADILNKRYGNILKTEVALRDRLWAAYQKTLIKDPKTNLIISAPVSLEEFYDLHLEPRAKAAETAQVDATKAAADAKAAEDAKKAKEDEDRAKKRADRSDIYAAGTNDNTDPDDKEWGAAHEAVYGAKK